jgi:pSer/pThr/pTyr-binding forkhead associated (FHA) protein
MLKLKKINSKHDNLIDFHEKTSIGREPDNDIVIDSYEISRHHCLIITDERHNVFVKDLNSLNGTFINNKRINRIQVEQYDILQIGDESFVFIDDVSNKQKKEKENIKTNLQSILLNEYSKEKIDGITIRITEESAKELHFPSNSIYTIGRLQFSDIVIEDESVSRTHATIDVRENRVVITDSHSTNGTSVNGEEITQKILKDGDTIGIGENNITVTFHIVNQEYFSSLRKGTNTITIDILEDYENLLKVYKSEYNHSILLEVERQSLIFCQEFEHHYRTYDNEESQLASIVKFISMLSKSMLIVDASTLKALRDEASNTEEIKEDCVQLFNKAIMERKGKKIIYYEEIESNDPSRIHMNGVSVTISNHIQLLIFGIPYDKLLYLIYASYWLGQLYVDMNETI